ERGPGTVINEADFGRAAHIALWHLSEARRFLGEYSMPKELANAARLDGWLVAQCQKAGTSTVSRREIQRCGPYAVRDKRALDPAIAELAELGRAREICAGKKRDVQVNPAL